MKIITATAVASLAVLSAFISTPAVADVYECTFKEGHVSKPTPTRVVIEIDSRRSEGKLLEIDIPGVLTQPGPITILRNNIKVASVEWDGRSYEYTPEARENGGIHNSGYRRVGWHTHHFSVFLKKGSLKALTRSWSSKTMRLHVEKSGTCVRLK